MQAPAETAQTAGVRMPTVASLGKVSKASEAMAGPWQFTSPKVPTYKLCMKEELRTGLGVLLKPYAGSLPESLLTSRGKSTFLASAQSPSRGRGRGLQLSSKGPSPPWELQTPSSLILCPCPWKLRPAALCDLQGFSEAPGGPQRAS